MDATVRGRGRIVTDGGNVASHASLVAREYGIPAVAATGNATQTIHDVIRLSVLAGDGTGWNA